MSVDRICTHMVATAAVSETARAAAARLAEHNLGCLAVLDDGGRPLGLLTDRDLAVEIVARSRDADSVIVGDIMTAPARTVRRGAAIEQALDMMRSASVRRLVVIDDEGRAVGMLSVDDVLELMSDEVAAVGELLRKEAPEL